MSIISIVAREILDSRGNPTVEVDLRTEKGSRCLARYIYIRRKLKHDIMLATRMSAQICDVENLHKSIEKAVARIINFTRVTSSHLHFTSGQINPLLGDE